MGPHTDILPSASLARASPIFSSSSEEYHKYQASFWGGWKAHWSLLFETKACYIMYVVKFILPGNQGNAINSQQAA